MVMAKIETIIYIDIGKKWFIGSFIAL
jgi:hypothetical protein